MVLRNESDDIKQGYFSTGSQNRSDQNMYLYLHYYLSTLYWLALLWPFFSTSLHPALMVPGYRQVSGRIKDLFCCFGAPVSVGSQGKGCSGSTTNLCLETGLTTLMCPRSVALPCYGTLSTLCGRTFDVPFY